MTCCDDILQNIPANAILLTSDEDHFYLFGYINKQKFPHWGENNPRQLHKRPLHNEQVTVWFGVVNYGVCSPYFFEKGDHSVTVASDQNVEMLWNFLEPKFRDPGSPDVWFQQDGATSSTMRISMEALTKCLQDI